MFGLVKSFGAGRSLFSTLRNTRTQYSAGSPHINHQCIIAFSSANLSLHFDSGARMRAMIPSSLSRRLRSVLGRPASGSVCKSPLRCAEAEEAPALYLHISPCGDWWVAPEIFAAKHLSSGYLRAIRIPECLDQGVLERASLQTLHRMYDTGELDASLEPDKCCK